MFKGIFVCFFALLCADRPTLGQTDKTQPSAVASAIDAEYRRFEEVSSFVRARNARDYAFSAAKGIDEASYITIGGIEQWITIRGEDRSNPVLLFLHYERALGWYGKPQLERNGALFGVHGLVRPKSV